MQKVVGLRSWNEVCFLYRNSSTKELGKTVSPKFGSLSSPPSIWIYSEVLSDTSLHLKNVSRVFLLWLSWSSSQNECYIKGHTLLDLLDIALVNSSELAIASYKASYIMSADLALCATAQSACVVSGKSVASIPGLLKRGPGNDCLRMR